MNRALSIGLCIAGFVVLLIVGINKYIKLKEQNDQLKADNLNLLRYHIEESKKPGKVEESLSGLAAYFGNKDQDISAELNIVLKRVRDGEKTDAVRPLAKIAENMLKEKAKNEDATWYTAFKNPAKIGLQNLCEWAKKTGFFNELEFNLALHMKDIRNDGSHNLNVEGKVDYNEEMFALHAGVKIMQKFVVV